MTETTISIRAKDNKLYLGDGVYASWDGYYILLTTEDGVEVSNRILMENEVLNNLLRFIKLVDITVKQWNDAKTAEAKD